MTANRVAVRDLAALNVLIRFQAATYTGDDGHPESKLMDVVAIALHDGREFFLSNIRMVPRYEMPGSEAIERYRPGVVIQRILDAGSIDLDNWIEIENMSFEDRMVEAAELEMRDRMEHGYSAASAFLM